MSFSIYAHANTGACPPDQAPFQQSMDALMNLVSSMQLGGSTNDLNRHIAEVQSAIPRIQNQDSRAAAARDLQQLQQQANRAAQIAERLSPWTDRAANAASAMSEIGQLSARLDAMRTSLGITDIGSRALVGVAHQDYLERMDRGENITQQLIADIQADIQTASPVDRNKITSAITHLEQYLETQKRFAAIQAASHQPSGDYGYWKSQMTPQQLDAADMLRMRYRDVAAEPQVNVQLAGEIDEIRETLTKLQDQTEAYLNALPTAHDLAVSTPSVANAERLMHVAGEMMGASPAALARLGLPPVRFDDAAVHDTYGTLMKQAEDYRTKYLAILANPMEIDPNRSQLDNQVEFEMRRLQNLEAELAKHDRSQQSYSQMLQFGDMLNEGVPFREAFATMFGNYGEGSRPRTTMREAMANVPKIEGERVSLRERLERYARTLERSLEEQKQELQRQITSAQQSIENLRTVNRPSVAPRGQIDLQSYYEHLVDTKQFDRAKTVGAIIAQKYPNGMIPLSSRDEERMRNPDSYSAVLGQIHDLDRLGFDPQRFGLDGDKPELVAKRAAALEQYLRHHNERIQPDQHIADVHRRKIDYSVRLRDRAEQLYANWHAMQMARLAVAEGDNLLRATKRYELPGSEHIDAIMNMKAMNLQSGRSVNMGDLLVRGAFMEATRGMDLSSLRGQRLDRARNDIYGRMQERIDYIAQRLGDPTIQQNRAQIDAVSRIVANLGIWRPTQLGPGEARDVKQITGEFDEDAEEGGNNEGREGFIVDAPDHFIEDLRHITRAYQLQLQDPGSLWSARRKNGEISSFQFAAKLPDRLPRGDVKGAGQAAIAEANSPTAMPMYPMPAAGNAGYYIPAIGEYEHPITGSKDYKKEGRSQYNTEQILKPGIYEYDRPLYQSSIGRKMQVMNARLLTNTQLDDPRYGGHHRLTTRPAMRGLAIMANELRSNRYPRLSGHLASPVENQPIIGYEHVRRFENRYDSVMKRVPSQIATDSTDLNEGERGYAAVQESHQYFDELRRMALFEHKAGLLGKPSEHDDPITTALKLAAKQDLTSGSLALQGQLGFDPEGREMLGERVSGRVPRWFDIMNLINVGHITPEQAAAMLGPDGNASGQQLEIAAGNDPIQSMMQMQRLQNPTGWRNAEAMTFAQMPTGIQNNEQLKQILASHPALASEDSQKAMREREQEERFFGSRTPPYLDRLHVGQLFTQAGEMGDERALGRMWASLLDPQSLTNRRIGAPLPQFQHEWQAGQEAGQYIMKPRSEYQRAGQHGLQQLGPTTIEEAELRPYLQALSMLEEELAKKGDTFRFDPEYRNTTALGLAGVVEGAGIGRESEVKDADAAIQRALEYFRTPTFLDSSDEAEQQRAQMLGYFNLVGKSIRGSGNVMYGDIRHGLDMLGLGDIGAQRFKHYVSPEQFGAMESRQRDALLTTWGMQAQTPTIIPGGLSVPFNQLPRGQNMLRSVMALKGGLTLDGTRYSERGDEGIGKGMPYLYKEGVALSIPQESLRQLATRLHNKDAGPDDQSDAYKAIYQLVFPSHIEGVFRSPTGKAIGGSAFGYRPEAQELVPKPANWNRDIGILQKIYGLNAAGAKSLLAVMHTTGIYSDTFGPGREEGAYKKDSPMTRKVTSWMWGQSSRELEKYLGSDPVKKLQQQIPYNATSPYYAGIGSRETPPEMLQLMEQLGAYYGDETFNRTLLTGGAKGADQAFTRGAMSVSGNVGVYLPTANFEPGRPRGEGVQEEILTNDQLKQIEAHPIYDVIVHAAGYDPRIRPGKDFTRRAFARNVMQVLTSTLKTPVREVIGYAPLNDQGQAKGGTRIAFAIAQALGIPVHNLADPNVAKRFQNMLNGTPPSNGGGGSPLLPSGGGGSFYGGSLPPAPPSPEEPDEPVQLQMMFGEASLNQPYIPSMLQEAHQVLTRQGLEGLSQQDLAAMQSGPLSPEMAHIIATGMYQNVLSNVELPEDLGQGASDAKIIQSLMRHNPAVARAVQNLAQIREETPLGAIGDAEQIAHDFAATSGITQGYTPDFLMMPPEASAIAQIGPMAAGAPAMAPPTMGMAQQGFLGALQAHIAHMGTPASAQFVGATIPGDPAALPGLNQLQQRRIQQLQNRITYAKQHPGSIRDASDQAGIVQAKTELAQLLSGSGQAPPPSPPVARQAPPTPPPSATPGKVTLTDIAQSLQRNPEAVSVFQKIMGDTGPTAHAIQAGPGAGKTYTQVRGVLGQLAFGQLPNPNAMVLVPTNAAKAAMEGERGRAMAELRKIQPDFLHGVPFSVRTYGSIAAEALMGREKGDYWNRLGWRGQPSTIMEEHQEATFLRNTLQHTFGLDPQQRPELFGRQYIEEAQQNISTLMANPAWARNALSEGARNFDTAGKFTGKFDPSDYNTLFTGFRQNMQSSGSISHNMLLLNLAMLTGDPEMAARLKDTFRGGPAVLGIDELQNATTSQQIVQQLLMGDNTGAVIGSGDRNQQMTPQMLGRNDLVHNIGAQMSKTLGVPVASHQMNINQRSSPPIVAALNALAQVPDEAGVVHPSYARLGSFQLSQANPNMFPRVLRVPNETEMHQQMLYTILDKVGLSLEEARGIKSQDDLEKVMAGKAPRDTVGLFSRRKDVDAFRRIAQWMGVDTDLLFNGATIKPGNLVDQAATDFMAQESFRIPISTIHGVVGRDFPNVVAQLGQGHGMGSKESQEQAMEMMRLEMISRVKDAPGAPGSFTGYIPENKLNAADYTTRLGVKGSGFIQRGRYRLDAQGNRIGDDKTNLAYPGDVPTEEHLMQARAAAGLVAEHYLLKKSLQVNPGQLPAELAETLRNASPDDIKAITQFAVNWGTGQAMQTAADPTQLGWEDTQGTMHPYPDVADVQSRQGNAGTAVEAFIQRMRKPTGQIRNPASQVMDEVKNYRGKIPYGVMNAATALTSEEVSGVVNDINQGKPIDPKVLAKNIQGIDTLISTLQQLPSSELGSLADSLRGSQAGASAGKRAQQGPTGEQGEATGGAQQTPPTPEGGTIYQGMPPGGGYNGSDQRPPDLSQNGPQGSGGSAQNRNRILRGIGSMSYDLNRIAWDAMFASQMIEQKQQAQIQAGGDFRMQEAIAETYGYAPAGAGATGANRPDNIVATAINGPLLTQMQAQIPGLSYTQALSAQASYASNFGGAIGTANIPAIQQLYSAAQLTGLPIEQVTQQIASLAIGSRSFTANNGAGAVGPQLQAQGTQALQYAYQIGGAAGLGQAIDAMSQMPGTSSQQLDFLMQTGQAFGGSPAALSTQAQMYSSLYSTLQHPDAQQFTALAYLSNPSMIQPGNQGDPFAAIAAFQKLNPSVVTPPDVLQAQAQNIQQNVSAQQMQMQLALHIPTLQITAEQANITLSQMSYQVQGMQIQQSQQQLDFQKYMDTALYGPIGADVSKNSYYQLQRSEAVAARNPLQTDQSTAMVQMNTFGLRNEEFYAGIEQQRQQLMYSHIGPLANDQAFRSQMQYLDKQESFYQRELDLQNQQRSETYTWQQNTIDWNKMLYVQQGKVLDANIALQQATLRIEANDESWMKQELQALSLQQLANKTMLNNAFAVTNSNPLDIIKQAGMSIRQDANNASQVQQLMNSLFPGNTQLAQAAYSVAQDFASHKDWDTMTTDQIIAKYGRTNPDLKQYSSLATNAAAAAAAGTANAATTAQSGSTATFTDFVNNLINMNIMSAKVANQFQTLNDDLGLLANGFGKLMPVLFGLSMLFSGIDIAAKVGSSGVGKAIGGFIGGAAKTVGGWFGLGGDAAAAGEATAGAGEATGLLAGAGEATAGAAGVAEGGGLLAGLGGLATAAAPVVIPAAILAGLATFMFHTDKNGDKSKWDQLSNWGDFGGKKDAVGKWMGDRIANVIEPFQDPAKWLGQHPKIQAIVVGLGHAAGWMGDRVGDVLKPFTNPAGWLNDHPKIKAIFTGLMQAPGWVAGKFGDMMKPFTDPAGWLNDHPKIRALFVGLGQAPGWIAGRFGDLMSALTDPGKWLGQHPMIQNILTGLGKAASWLAGQIGSAISNLLNIPSSIVKAGGNLIGSIGGALSSGWNAITGGGSSHSSTPTYAAPTSSANTINLNISVNGGSGTSISLSNADIDRVAAQAISAIEAALTAALKH